MVVARAELHELEEANAKISGNGHVGQWRTGLGMNLPRAKKLKSLGTKKLHLLVFQFRKKKKMLKQLR